MKSEYNNVITTFDKYKNDSGVFFINQKDKADKLVNHCKYTGFDVCQFEINENTVLSFAYMSHYDIGEKFLLKFTRALARVSEVLIFSQDGGIAYEIGKDYEKQVESIDLEQFSNLRLTDFIPQNNGTMGRSKFILQKEILNEDYMVFVNSKLN